MNSRLHWNTPVYISIAAVRQPGRYQYLVQNLLSVHFQFNHQIGTPARAYLASPTFTLVYRQFCKLFRSALTALAHAFASMPETQLNQCFISFDSIHVVSNYSIFKIKIYEEKVPIAVKSIIVAIIALTIFIENAITQFTIS